MSLLKAGHQRACKTMCHLVIRSYSCKACKHTAIPLVTPGAGSSAQLLSLAQCHVLTWVCQCLLLIWPGDYFNLRRGGVTGDSLMQDSQALYVHLPLPPGVHTWSADQLNHSDHPTLTNARTHRSEPGVGGSSNPRLI